MCARELRDRFQITIAVDAHPDADFTHEDRDNVTRIAREAIVNACRPWDWRHEFPEVASAPPELRKQVEQKWAREIFAATNRG